MHTQQTQLINELPDTQFYSYNSLNENSQNIINAIKIVYNTNQLITFSKTFYLHKYPMTGKTHIKHTYW